MIGWKFRLKLRSELQSDPIQDRFFTTSDVSNISTALVRESIQNSLDARIDKAKSPAIVRFFIHNEILEKDHAYQYIEEL